MVVVILALVYWLVSLISLPEPFGTIIRVLFILIAVLYTLQAFGIVRTGSIWSHILARKIHEVERPSLTGPVWFNFMLWSHGPPSVRFRGPLGQALLAGRRWGWSAVGQVGQSAPSLKG